MQFYEVCTFSVSVISVMLNMAIQNFFFFFFFFILPRIDHFRSLSLSNVFDNIQHVSDEFADSIKMTTHKYKTSKTSYSCTCTAAFNMKHGGWKSDTYTNMYKERVFERVYRSLLMRVHIPWSC